MKGHQKKKVGAHFNLYIKAAMRLDLSHLLRNFSVRAGKQPRLISPLNTFYLYTLLLKIFEASVRAD